jgi:MFS family permease
MSRITRFIPHAAACFAGFAVMSLELLGSRLVAPVLGSSILIWTNLIGVILLALALGAWLGGRYADRSPDRRLIAGLLFGAGLWSAGLAVASKYVLSAFSSLSPEVAAPFAALVLLSVPAALLGAVSPAVLRLTMKDVEHSGRTAGMLSALGTVGSLFGTYVTGYILLPRFRTSELLLGLAFILAAAAFLIVLPALRRRHAAVGIFAMTFVSQPWQSLSTPGVNEYPSAYGFVAAVQAMTSEGPANSLMINKGFHAASHTATPKESVLDYVRAIDASLPHLPTPARTLALGGGGFHVAHDVLSAFPESTIDVVEIDPAVMRVSEDLFELREDPRMRITMADARTDIRRRPSGSYELLIQDAYGGDTSAPWHLMTKESFAEYARLLTPNGVFVANVIMPTDPKAGSQGEQFSQDFVATAGTAFSWMYAVSTMNTENVEIPANLIFFAGNGERPNPDTILGAIQTELVGNPVRFAELSPGGQVWTDDFGPADFESMAMYREAALQ